MTSWWSVYLLVCLEAVACVASISAWVWVYARTGSGELLRRYSFQIFILAVYVFYLLNPIPLNWSIASRVLHCLIFCLPHLLVAPLIIERDALRSLWAGSSSGERRIPVVPSRATLRDASFLIFLSVAAFAIVWVVQRRFIVFQDWSSFMSSALQ